MRDPFDRLRAGSGSPGYGGSDASGGAGDVGDLDDGGGGGLVVGVVEEGVAGFLPAVKASAQGADAEDAELVELQGDLGAGLLAGAGAVEDDVAVEGDDVLVLGELVGADAQGSGEDAGVGQV